MLWLRSLQVTISESWCCESLVMSETSEPKDTAPQLLSGEQRSYDPNHIEHCTLPGNKTFTHAKLLLLLWPFFPAACAKCGLPSGSGGACLKGSFCMAAA